MIRGSCLCGDIRFETAAAPQGPSMCHCSQCRKQSGGVWASAYVPETELILHGPVSWYAASVGAERGFCVRCGSFLFWKAHDEDTISFALGAVEDPSGLKIEKHIFCASKGDYYEIADGLPQKP
ncbi:aldehyde-activating protein [Phaeobacter gallaeciensis]|uniref:Aldehyde-activating protein n=1 Tax=Phaeobacter gallaeciensis TaxID=60890 RepID=A0A1B0ZS93_9RHOB|nr:MULTISPECIES: GFA family protein [Phaeobacter]ANP36948.1 aldehyde-activating protein [Phaeobacter gallaeciensis]MDE4060935.1 GFA family protein [Phaeobacter gallaeciensis]MDE4123954.1 GFA family protein [Phaeobacter gallaeciensis]MDE4128424.1 GFA family protein [Phaeobacter gallaeciensis]PVZ46308.1 GFA family protein [Phaeobacter sp. JL2872]